MKHYIMTNKEFMRILKRFFALHKDWGKKFYQNFNRKDFKYLKLKNHYPIQACNLRTYLKLIGDGNLYIKGYRITHFNMIEWAFNWDLTEEGYWYWLNVCNEWNMFIRKIKKYY